MYYSYCKLKNGNGVENEAIQDVNYFCGTVMITDIIMATLK